MTRHAVVLVAALLAAGCGQQESPAAPTVLPAEIVPASGDTPATVLQPSAANHPGVDGLPQHVMRSARPDPNDPNQAACVGSPDYNKCAGAHVNTGKSVGGLRVSLTSSQVTVSWNRDFSRNMDKWEFRLENDAGTVVARGCLSGGNKWCENDTYANKRRFGRAWLQGKGSGPYTFKVAARYCNGDRCRTDQSDYYYSYEASVSFTV